MEIKPDFVEELDSLPDQKQESILKGLLKQPKPAWAVAFACVIAFMGIGLVDPILKSISEQLHATPAETSLLFTSYMLVTGIVMLFSGYISSRIGAKKTILYGLVIIIIFAVLGGFSNSVGELVGFRAGWGLGNALFISTALSAIVGVSVGGTEQSIIMYEAAMGIRYVGWPFTRRIIREHFMACSILWCSNLNGSRLYFSHNSIRKNP